MGAERLPTSRPENGPSVLESVAGLGGDPHRGVRDAAEEQHLDLRRVGFALVVGGGKTEWNVEWLADAPGIVFTPLCSPFFSLLGIAESAALLLSHSFVFRSMLTLSHRRH